MGGIDINVDVTEQKWFCNCNRRMEYALESECRILENITKDISLVF